jgi:hypothetical protein
MIFDENKPSRTKTENNPEISTFDIIQDFLRSTIRETKHSKEEGVL